MRRAFVIVMDACGVGALPDAAAYGDDPAARFTPKGEDLRDALLLARMQKAAAILQFKLEGQTTRRNPHFELEHRNLLHRIDPKVPLEDQLGELVLLQQEGKIRHIGLSEVSVSQIEAARERSREL